MKDIMGVLDKKKIKYKYLEDWRSLIIKDGDLRVEIDPIEDCKENFAKLLKIL